MSIPTNKNKSREGGFIKLIVIIVIVIIILTVLKINLKDIIDSPTTASNLETIKELALKTWEAIVYIWQNYIQEPALYIWNEWLVAKIFPFITNWLNGLK